MCVCVWCLTRLWKWKRRGSCRSLFLLLIMDNNHHNIRFESKITGNVATIDALQEAAFSNININSQKACQQISLDTIFLHIGLEWIKVKWSSRKEEEESEDVDTDSLRHTDTYFSWVRMVCWSMTWTLGTITASILDNLMITTCPLDMFINHHLNKSMDVETVVGVCNRIHHIFLNAWKMKMKRREREKSKHRSNTI